MEARLKQLLLMAFTSDQQGEILNAIGMVRKKLQATKQDAHQLVDGMVKDGPAPRADQGLGEALAELRARQAEEQARAAHRKLHLLQQQLDQQQQANQALSRELMLMRQQNQAAPRTFHESFQGQQARPPEDAWLLGGMPPQVAAEWLVDNANLSRKEEEFCSTIMGWRGMPTEKQMGWLRSLWERHHG